MPMLTKGDLQQISKIVHKVVHKEIKVVRTDMKVMRDDLKGDFKFLNSQIDRLDRKIDGSEERLGKKIDEVMNHVDGFTTKQEKFDAELASHQAALKRLGAFPAEA